MRTHYLSTHACIHMHTERERHTDTQAYIDTYADGRRLATRGEGMLPPRHALSHSSFLVGHRAPRRPSRTCVYACMHACVCRGPGMCASFLVGHRAPCRPSQRHPHHTQNACGPIRALLHAYAHRTYNASVHLHIHVPCAPIHACAQ